MSKVTSNKTGTETVAVQCETNCLSVHVIQNFIVFLH